MRIHILLVQTFLSAICVTMAFAQMAPFSARDPRYLLQPSDVLEIHYRYSPEFDQTVTVQPDGFVGLPLVGDMKLQGLTVDQAKAAILDKAAQRLKDPRIRQRVKQEMSSPADTWENFFVASPKSH